MGHVFCQLSAALYLHWRVFAFLYGGVFLDLSSQSALLGQLFAIALIAQTGGVFPLMHYLVSL